MIDLKAQFGERYKIALDESAEILGQSMADRLWLYRIACKRGHVYLHGENTLGGYTNRKFLRRKLAAVPGVKVHQMGDTECTVTFALDALPGVLDVLVPRLRSRPTLTQEQRDAARVRMLALHDARRRFRRPGATLGGP